MVLSSGRYCQQVLNETVRTAKLTPVAARLQEVEGKVGQHVIPKEVCEVHLWIDAVDKRRECLLFLPADAGDLRSGCGPAGC